MALLPCRECGRHVSTEAPFCPQCGVPNPTRGMTPAGSHVAPPPLPTPPPLPPAVPRNTRPAVPSPSPSSPAWSALEGEKRSSPWLPLLAVGGFMVLVAIVAISSAGGSADAGGSSAFTASPSTEAEDRTRDSTRAAGIHARLATASRADLADLDWIEHRWSLPHDSAVHARAQTALLDSAAALLARETADPSPVLAAVRTPLTARQTERNEQLKKRSSARAEAASWAAASAAAKATDAAKWSYSSATDQMTGKTSRTARIQSENTVNFDFPYQGAQLATLVIRNHPSYGRDAILRIEQGQILCPSYDDCTVKIRFDDGQAESWTAAGAADHSTTAVFIRSNDRFLQRMRSANVVRIQIPVYQEGNPTFEFRVGGYDHDRYTRGN